MGEMYKPNQPKHQVVSVSDTMIVSGAEGLTREQQEELLQRAHVEAHAQKKIRAQRERHKQRERPLQDQDKILRWMLEHHDASLEQEPAIGVDPQRSMNFLGISADELIRTHNALRDRIRVLLVTELEILYADLENEIQKEYPEGTTIPDAKAGLTQAFHLETDDARLNDLMHAMVALRAGSAATKPGDYARVFTEALQADLDGIGTGSPQLSSDEIEKAFVLISTLLLDQMRKKYKSQVGKLLRQVLDEYTQGDKHKLSTEFVTKPPDQDHRVDWAKVLEKLAQKPRSPQYEKEIPAALALIKDRISDKKRNDAKEKEKQDWQRIQRLYSREKGVIWTKEAMVEATGLPRARATVLLSELIDNKNIAALDDRSGETIYLLTDGTLQYEPSELLSIIDRRYFDQVGRFVYEKICLGEKIDKKFLERTDVELGLPAQVATMILDTYLALGVLRKERGAYVLSKKCGNQAPGFHHVQQVAIATEVHAMDGEDIVTEEGFEKANPSLEAIYAKFKKEHATAKPEIKTKDTPKILYLTQALHGDPELDLKFLERSVKEMEALPEDERPDAVVMAGLTYGEFNALEKTQRRRVVMPLGKQMYYAKQLVDRFRNMGIKVLYTFSKNDMLEIDHLAIGMVFDIEGVARKGRKHIPGWAKDDGWQLDGSSTIYGKVGDVGPDVTQIDQARRHPLYMRHLRFSWDIAYPYMMRTGRALRGEKEMFKSYGVNLDEYLMLYYYMKQKKHGLSNNDIEMMRVVTSVVNVDGEQRVISTKVPIRVVDMIEKDALPVDGNDWPDFHITDDFNAKFVGSDGEEVTADVYYNTRLTNTAMVQDPTAEQRLLVDHQKAEGEEVADFNVDAGQRMGVAEWKTGSGVDDVCILQTPSMMRTDLNLGSFATSPLHQGRRIRTQRRMLEVPGMVTTQKFTDGRWITEFYNDKLLDIAHQTAERIAVVILSDFQTGSVTARPDLQAKMLDYVFHDLLKRRKVILNLLGDQIQGRNYPGMPNESQGIGLITVDSQTEFLIELIRKAMADATPEALQNLIRVGISAGNHEWNTGRGKFADTGASHILPLKYFLEGQLRDTDTEVRTHNYKPEVTRRGEWYPGWATTEETANYKILFDHYMVERFGKGSGGLAVYAARDRIRGAAELVDDTNFLINGHFHHPSWLMYGSKVGIINGAEAGQSHYEVMRAYRPLIGPSILHLGGGRAPALEVWSHKAHVNYTPQGQFSREHLAEEGYTDDLDFDPWQHGFGKMFMPRNGVELRQWPQSGAQKWLWNQIDRINGQVLSAQR